VSRTRQSGYALIMLLAVLTAGGSWLAISRFNALRGDYTAANRERNAAVLAQAKRALIGHVALQAAKVGEANPGRLPCPEAPANYGGPLEGATAGNCNLPAVGRLPWRTIGLDKLVDASGEALWYVVSPGWALSNATVPALTTTINSDSIGQLTLDGLANDSIALIIAPGQAMNIQASPGCAARNQARNSLNYDPLDYLECFNAAASSFATRGPAASFNDQVVKITAAELLPAIEAAIAQRIQQEHAASMRGYYGGAWAGSLGAGQTSVLPFAAQFANPTASAMKGSSPTAQGLLPLNYSETAANSGASCTPGADPRCDPMFVAWTGTPTLTDRGGGAVMILPPACAVNVVTVNPVPLTQTTRIDCTVHAVWLFATPINFNFAVQGNARNVGMALRQFNTAVTMPGVDPAGRTATGVLNNDGSASITFNGSAPMGGGLLGQVVALLDCGLGVLFAGILDCLRYNISVPVNLLADAPMVDPNQWFARNRWHEVSYYAAAGVNLPNSAARACTTAVNCLVVANGPNDRKQRGIVILSGRRLGAQARPPLAVADLLEGANAGGVSPFEARSTALISNVGFNDRFAVIDANP
jgi:hypothetical protein